MKYRSALIVLLALLGFTAPAYAQMGDVHTAEQRASRTASIRRLVVAEIQRIGSAMARSLAIATARGVNVTPWSFAAGQFFSPAATADERTEERHLAEARAELARRRQAQAELERRIRSSPAQR